MVSKFYCFEEKFFLGGFVFVFKFMGGFLKVFFLEWFIFLEFRVFKVVLSCFCKVLMVVFLEFFVLVGCGF